MQKKARLTINVPPEDLQELHLVAKREDVSVSTLLRRYIAVLAAGNRALSSPALPGQNMHTAQQRHATEVA